MTGELNHLHNHPDHAATLVPRSLDLQIDQVVDEVFADVEHLLGSDGADSQAPDYITLEPLETPTQPTPPPETPPVSLSRFGSLDLLIAALIPLAACAGLLRFWVWPRLQVAAPAPVAPTVVASPDPFGQYLVRSLDQLEQAAQTKALAGDPLAALLRSGGLPTTPGNRSDLTDALNRLANTLEQRQSPSLPPVPAPSAIAPRLPKFPTLSSPGSVQPQSPQNQSSQTQSKVAPQPTLQLPAVLPDPSTLQTAKLEPSLTLPLPTLPPAAPPASVNRSSGQHHKLVGVLNLGDRSAALVDTNGEVRRVRIGEKLENSDWVLVSVSGQEATLQRRNEVRSVTVDQQF